MAGPPATRTRSHDRSACAATAVPQNEAIGLLAGKGADVVQAIAKADPVLQDPSQPLLSHKLATLPTLMHLAACQHLVDSSNGSAQVGMDSGSHLLQALLALCSTTGLVDLSLGLDQSRRSNDGYWVELPKATMQSQLKFMSAAQQHIVQLSQLTSMCMHGACMRTVNAVLPALAMLPKLASLSLCGADVASSDADPADVTSRSFRHYEARIRARAQAFGAGLAACSRLHSLVFTSRSGDCGHNTMQWWAPHLATMSHLRHLSAGGLWGDGFEAFLGSITKLSRLQQLAVTDLTMSGSAIQQLSCHLSALTSLQHLSFRRGNSWAAELRSGCSRLTLLTLLAVRTHELDGVDEKRLTQFVPVLVQLSLLIHLELEQVMTGDANACDLAAGISQLAQLQHLVLTGDGFGDHINAQVAGAQAMQAALQALTHLDLSHAFDLSNYDSEDEAEAQASEQAHTPRQVPVPGGAAQLVHLELESILFPKVTEPELANALARLTSLTYCSVPSADTPPASVGSLVEKALARLSSREALVPAIPPSLHSVHLNRWLGGAASVQAMASQLACLSQLTQLRVDMARVPNGAAADLVQCIATLTSLQCLTCCAFGHEAQISAAQVAAATAIARYLPLLTGLTVLKLSIRKSSKADSEAGFQLSAGLVALAPRLQPPSKLAYVCCEGALKQLPCSMSRLHLGYVGLDDVCVDELRCNVLLAPDMALILLRLVCKLVRHVYWRRLCCFVGDVRLIIRPPVRSARNMCPNMTCCKHACACI
jgi:hypothetical protein